MTATLPADIVRPYRDRTPKSRELWERALRVFPLGVSANVKSFAGNAR